MSDTEVDKKVLAVPGKRKRTRDTDEEAAKALEIDVNAPEPPSKKALRKMKKQKEKGDKKEDRKEEAQTEETGDSEKKESKTAGDGDNEAPKKKTEKGHKKSSDAKHENGRKATTNTAATTSSGPQRSQFGVWVGNLSFMVNPDELRNFFIDQGHFQPEQITRMNMPKGVRSEHMKFQPNNKGFAYVDFADEDCVRRAIALSEKELNKRNLLIKDANNYSGRPKKETGPEDAESTRNTTPYPKRDFGQDKSRRPSDNRSSRPRDNAHPKEKRRTPGKRQRAEYKAKHPKPETE